MLENTAIRSVSSMNGKYGITTPPMPAHLPPVQGLSDNARTVLSKRYLRRGPDGKPVETVEEMFWRVASHIASADAAYGLDPQAAAEQFYSLLTNFRFMPNSPTFTGSGTPLGQLAACFVLPIEDDMGRTGSGIFETLRNAALIQQTGGGNGFSFSRLRPQGTLVNSSAGQATGPVGFLRVYDRAFGEIAQGGTRRGANMGVLRVDHPDIEAFITCKTDENAITNFNISVGITDDFMQAVNDDADWPLRFIDMEAPEAKNFRGTLEQAEAAGVPIRTHRVVRARTLFNAIVEQAHHNGEPGVLFLTRANDDNPVPHLYPLEATNPCGEQWLGPFENCCLGSVNLARHATLDGRVDWDKLRESVVLSTRFLDNVVSANAYVPAVPELKVAAHQARRIGLGIMGLADLMYHARIRYGSEEAQEFAAQVMEFVRYHAMQTSIDLARQRGPFEAIEGSIYDPANLTWTPPTPLQAYRSDFGRPSLDWNAIVDGIREHGIRNAAQTTIAPTGTIATVSGCEGYGCEPNFALAYIRHVNDNGTDLELTYTSPLFEAALDEIGLEATGKRAVIEQVMNEGTCQNVAVLPQRVRDAFVVSSDITADEHVRMQAALQAFVDNSISKTCNFPANATTRDVAEAYKLAWELGAKGLTVYVTGSRDKVVLETHATRKAKEAPEPVMLFHETKKPRPTRLKGVTYQIGTPLGKSYVTINENGGNLPFEVFVSTAKAGTDTFAVSEAIGRLISYVLRLSSPVNPRERLEEISRQLIGIGGGRPLGFGPNRVRSLPDGVAQALIDYLGDTELGPDTPDLRQDIAAVPETAPRDHQLKLEFGDLCPECGEPTFVREEGCRKCYSCGYSEC